MEATELAKKGKALNIALIVITVCMFAFFQVERRLVAAGGIDDSILVMETAALWIYRIVSLVCVAFSVILVTKNQSKIKGINMLLASSIVSLVFSVLGLMLGIVIWALSGASLKQLSQTLSENSFKQKLESQDSAQNE